MDGSLCSLAVLDWSLHSMGEAGEPSYWFFRPSPLTTKSGGISEFPIRPQRSEVVPPPCFDYTAQTAVSVTMAGGRTHMPIIEVVQRIEVPELPDIDLPYDDGEPLESNWHRLQINLLSDALHQHWQGHTDFFAGGNMFVYSSLEQARTRDYK